MKPYRVPELAEKYINYDMIQNHTELPDFPDARVHLLYIFLKDSGRNIAGLEELYALVASLVQMGLDTHESIDVAEGNQGEAMMRSRQLKVLAGDYFSSRFYQLLAQKGEIAVISLLSRAVSSVNVMKMNLYGKMKDTLVPSEEYLRQTVQLNMQLFLSFTPLLEKSVHETWRTLLKEFTQCETLVQEMKRCVSPDSGRWSYSYWHLIETANEEERKLLVGKKADPKDWKKLILKYKAAERILDKLRETVANLQQLLAGRSGDCPYAGLLEPFLHRLGTVSSVVRGG
ncbi:heptaprenyl diphosphate synthase component 1 [Paenibacillus ihbetae]|uniref:Heptaprenyl diphosphate synthase n=1 Tax=Paenibacillus ihbetae TaxID=1870820 RepID=A0A1B2DVT4_9BACL|nr:heptaprenyl diphosphate synthase component 1 [Paenibacillus ihbetae]ANY71832.1 heptaprenyl diphosphate synthase [Paenibacillus ihbetae]OOC60862.1 heptaprenyl diphosphate synthase [Paenibacillus ihbetae]